MDGEREHSTPSGVSTIASGSRLDDGARLPAIGDIVGGKYELVRVVGAGSMGVVYEAMHRRLRQRLAIKVLRSDAGDIDQLLARFEREARTSAQLRSVHTARVIDVDSLPNGVPYMVMEYLEGRGLDAELAATGPMPVELAADIAMQVADAMTEAHGLGIVHRDLKPSNLFVCRVGERPVIKVLDFGIARNDGDARMTAGEWLGTPSYVAPERLRLTSDADARSDIWSLGIILFELLTGRAPFEGGAVQVLANVLVAQVPSPSEFRPTLPRDLCRIVMRALERAPADRFQSMREMGEALATFGPQQLASTVVQGIQRGRGRLGEILMAEGFLTQRDLDDALAIQHREGRLLGQVLVEMGFVGHADLLTVLAKQQGLPAMSKPGTPTPPNAAGPPIVTVGRGAPTLPPARPETPIPLLPTPALPPSLFERAWLWPAAVAVLVLLCAAALEMAHWTGAQPPMPPAIGTPQ